MYSYKYMYLYTLLSVQFTLYSEIYENTFLN